jgi:hypothetical protein
MPLKLEQPEMNMRAKVTNPRTTKDFLIMTITSFLLLKSTEHYPTWRWPKLTIQLRPFLSGAEEWKRSPH